MPKTETTPADDFTIIRRGLDALCEQLPEGSILNPAVRIMSALTRLENHVDSMENAMVEMSDSLGVMANE